MSSYTLILDGDQKDLIVKALSAYGQMFVGQTASDQAAAKKLEPHIAKANHYSPTDLSSNKY